MAKRQGPKKGGSMDSREPPTPRGDGFCSTYVPIALECAQHAIDPSSTRSWAPYCKSANNTGRGRKKQVLQKQGGSPIPRGLGPPPMRAHQKQREPSTYEGRGPTLGAFIPRGKKSNPRSVHNRRSRHRKPRRCFEPAPSQPHGSNWHRL